MNSPFRFALLVTLTQFPSRWRARMTTSSEFPEKPRSKSRDRISSFMLKKSSTSLESATPWSKVEEKHKLNLFEKNKHGSCPQIGDSVQQKGLGWARVCDMQQHWPVPQDKKVFSSDCFLLPLTAMCLQMADANC